jgi:hypothetical protein
MTDMVRVVTNSTDSFAEEKTFKIYKIPVRKVFISSAVSNYSHKSVQNRTLLLLILFVLFGLGHRFFFFACLFIHSFICAYVVWAISSPCPPPPQHKFSMDIVHTSFIKINSICKNHKKFEMVQET